MTRLSRALALAGALCLALVSGATAQLYPSGSIQGNAGASDAPPRAITPTAWLDRWCGSTAGFVPYRGASAWACAAPGSTSGVQAWDADLTALAAFSSTGFAARTASNTWAQRTLTAPAAGFTITNPAGVAGDPTFVLANDLAALEAMSGTGLVARTGSETYAQLTLTGPAAGITVSNGDGVSGNPTLALANDLLALEGLSSTGFAARTTADTWAQRTVTGTAAEITVTNGDGVSGNPTLSLPTALTFTGKTVTGGSYAFGGHTTWGTDNTFDVGASGATRPRTGYFGTSVVAPAMSATTFTGVLSGNATTATALATTRGIYGNNFDGSAALTQIIASTYGGTGNGFTKFTGPATAERTFTLPNADATIAYTAQNLSVFAATTSAQLRGVLSDETGSGAAVFADAPTISAPVITGLADVQQGISFTGDITPTQIAATTDDYAPTGFSAATVVRISTDASRDITGLAGGSDGRKIYILNVGSFSAVLKDEGAGSTAANRFGFGADLTLASKQGASLVYDATASRWRQVGGPSSSGGGSGTVTSIICNGGATTITTSGTCASRELLSANRTYYFRTDGNDSNTGLVNSSGGAFLTIQKCVDVAAALDLSVYSATCKSGTSGAFNNAVVLKSYVGAGPITIEGDTATPANVTITVDSANAFTANSVVGAYALKGIKTVTTTGGLHFYVINSTLSWQNWDFGAAAGGSAHIFGYSGARLSSTGAYTISGSAGIHMQTASGTTHINSGSALTVSGTPAWGTAFAYAITGSIQDWNGASFAGSATGPRYNCNANSVLNVAGGGASFLPGNSAGSATTGCQYN